MSVSVICMAGYFTAYIDWKIATKTILVNTTTSHGKSPRDNSNSRFRRKNEKDVVGMSGLS